MRAVQRLHRRLSEQVAAHGEGRKELVVQIVAVGQHHQGRVRHAWLKHQQARVERHQQALARTLGVPDHACLAVTRWLRFDAGQPVIIGVFPHPGHRSCGERGERRAQRGGHRLLHRVELVVAGDDLDQPATGFAEHGEVAQQIEEAPLLEHALDQRGHLRHPLGLDSGAVGGAPRHEALLIRR